MSCLHKPTQIKVLYPIQQKVKLTKSDCSTEDDLSFIDSLRAEAQNPMIKNFLEMDCFVDDTQDLEEFLNSLD